jgi:hypothetical protein
VLTPMFKSTLRGAYKFGQKTREMVAEATAKAASKAVAEAQKA